jgi:hypothetical protein
MSAFNTQSEIIDLTVVDKTETVTIDLTLDDDTPGTLHLTHY